jgi:hypothetical protein
MGVQKIARDSVRGLSKEGYYRFVAIFTWTGQDDKVALERLSPFIGHKLLSEMGIDPETYQTYYLTGARTELCIGYTNSAAGLKRFHSAVCFGTNIEAKFYHAVEGYEAAEAAKAAPK